MLKPIWAFLVSTSILLALSPIAHAQNSMSLSGFIKDNNNNPLNGEFEFKATLWNHIDDQGTNSHNASWEEFHTINIPSTNNGKFTVPIGSTVNIPSTLLAAFPYVQIEVRKLPAGSFEVLDPEPNNNAVDRLRFTADQNNLKNNTLTISHTNPLNKNFQLQFGESLQGFIEYNEVQNFFTISGDLTINGNLTVNGTINGINLNQLKGNLGSGIYHTFDLKDISKFTYDSTDTGDNILLQNGQITIKDSLATIFSDYKVDSNPYSNTPHAIEYSSSDELLYIGSRSLARVFAIDPTTKRIVHQIGEHGYGNRGIYNLRHIEISKDGLTMAITSDSHFVSVWKRATINDNWAFAFDIGTPSVAKNISDGSSLYSPREVAIRPSDKHIFVGAYYGFTKDFNSYNIGYGGVAEYDENGNFLQIAIYRGKYNKNGSINEGEAQYVHAIEFDDQNNLWISNGNNQIGQFNSSTWRLNKTLFSNNNSPKQSIITPTNLEVLPNNKLAVHNGSLKAMQIWDINTSKVIHSFGHQLNSSDNRLSTKDVRGLTANGSTIFYNNYTDGNVQTLNFSELTKTSRLIFPELQLSPNTFRLKRLIVNKISHSDLTKIKFQYRLKNSDPWSDVPENYDLSNINFSSGTIQIAAIINPEITYSKEYSQDIINHVQIEYGL